MNKFEYLVNDVEEFLKINEEESQKIESKTMKKLISVQDKIKIFKNISYEELKAIIYDLKFVRYEYKDHIVEQDSTSEIIYYLIDGECQVFQNSNKIGELHSGSTFGESGAIFEQKRSATVICASKTATLLSFKIDKNNLEFASNALAILYRNLAFEINAKLNDLNKNISAKTS